MAIYHASFKILSRSQGRSSIQFSSYIAGVKLFDNRLGISFDHTSKEEVVYSEVSLPAHAKKGWIDRSILWNEVESFEKNKNAQVARTFEIAIPIEWSQQEAKERCKEYVLSSLVDRGMCVDWAIHWKDGNPHLQGLATLRQIDDKGNWKDCKQKKVYELDEKGEKIPVIDKKTGVQKVDNRNRKQWKRITVEDNTWNHRGTLKEWRKEWADLANKYLQEENKIDERSYQEQGIDRIPTQKEGYVARKMEERGLISERCERNREIKVNNNELEELSREIETNRRDEQLVNNSFGDDFKTVYEPNNEDYIVVPPTEQKCLRIAESGNSYSFLDEYGNWPNKSVNFCEDFKVITSEDELNKIKDYLIDKKTESEEERELLNKSYKSMDSAIVSGDNKQITKEFVKFKENTKKYTDIKIETDKCKKVSDLKRIWVTIKGIIKELIMELKININLFNSGLEEVESQRQAINAKFSKKLFLGKTTLDLSPKDPSLEEQQDNTVRKEPRN